MNPKQCEGCKHLGAKDRREDYGDVCMPVCEKLKVWLDFYNEPPCKKGGN